MLVYGDLTRSSTTGEVLARLRDDLARAWALGPGLARHVRLTAALIEAGRLAQALADARFDLDGGHDRPSAQVQRALALVQVLAAGCAISWRSGFDRCGLPPHGAFDRLAAGWPDEALDLREPEGYAFYALYPESYLEAAQRLHLKSPQVIGIRSIGTSLGAMVAAQLGGRSLLTLRPSGHPFARSISARERLVDPGADGFVIVDEGPGLSGSSMAAVAQWLGRAGVRAERLHFMVSHGHGAGPQASESTREIWRRAQVHVADADRTVLHARLPAHRLQSWVEALVGPLHAPLRDISGGRWVGLQVHAAGDEPPVHPARERRKFLATSDSGRWLVKFIGLGHEGERKFARAQALAAAGFSPKPEGLCHGYIVERWRDDLAPLPPPWRMAGDVRARLVDRMGDYLGFRARRFASPCTPGASVRGLWEMARHNTEAAFGPALALAWDAWLPALDTLQGLLRPVETDNRMHPWEWLAGEGTFLKTDAVDHHAGHELVGCQDIAWDIAGAAVEYQLSADELRRLIARCGHVPAPVALRFMRRCYLAFELARSSEVASDPAQRAAANRYRHMLQSEIAAGRPC